METWAGSGVGSSSVDLSRFMGGDTITDGWMKEAAGSGFDIFGCLKREF